MSDLKWLDDVTLEQLDVDPYPVYERLRPVSGIAFIPAYRQYVAITWESCKALAEDKETFHGGTDPALEHVFGQPCVLTVEGETHRDLRSMMDPYLRPRPVRGYIDDLVRPTVRRQLEALAPGETQDLVQAYFEPISVRALGDFLGYRDVETDTLRRWFDGLSRGFSNKALDAEGNTLHPEGFAPSDAVSEEIRQITDPMIERLTGQPDDSGISHWIHDGMPSGEVRPNSYIYPTLFTIILGGMQEPGHLMGSTLLGLHTNPEQLSRVLADRTLIPKAITEGLRWLAPIQCASSRKAMRDIDVFGAQLKAGDPVFMSYGSANRDEKEFDNAAVYDFDRSPHPHLAFGAGRHACAGSSFASETCRIALEELFGAFPKLEKDPDHDVPVRGFFFRGPKELRVKLTA